jgi:hypothetical protein
MAIELFNIGKIANDGTGDDLREAFIKINRSLEDLDLRIDDKTEGENVGSGTGVFYRRDGYNLQFKSLTSTNSTIAYVDNTTSVDIKIADGAVDTPLVTDSGAFTLTRAATLNIRGSGSVTTEADGDNNTITINGGSNLVDDPNPVLSAPMNAGNYNIFNVNTLTANDIESTVYGVDIRTLASAYDSFDFGPLIVVTSEVNNFLDYVRATTDIDLGTFLSPTGVDIDHGTLV